MLVRKDIATAAMMKQIEQVVKDQRSNDGSAFVFKRVGARILDLKGSGWDGVRSVSTKSSNYH